jgi:hypothetical protein
MSVKSAAARTGKKASQNKVALSAASVTSCCVVGCRIAGIILGATLPLVLAQLASLQSFSGNSAASSTQSLCMRVIALQIALAL